MDSLQVSDQQAAAVAKAPRVQLSDIEAAVQAEYTFSAKEAVAALNMPAHDALDILTIHIVVLKNGFTVIGKSAPASPENFNAELGAKLAREDCIRQLWPLMGFCLRDNLYHSKDKQEG